MRRAPRDRGFTLVEILIAIVLVGVLSAVVVVGVSNLTSKGQAAACSTSLDAARVAATAHTVTTGSAPTTFSAMVTSGALTLPSGVTVDSGGTKLVGSGWTLAMRSTNPLVLECTSGPSTPVLELVTATKAEAFSLRRLSSTYTGAAVTVRRASDNTSTDIGFTGAGALDTAALLAFVGSGNGFVSTWYDQSGNGRHATQTTAAAQPRIVNAGTYENGVNFVSGTWFNVTGTPTSWSASVVGAPVAPGPWRTLFYTGGGQHPVMVDAGSTSLGTYDGSGFRSAGLTWSSGELAVVHVDATTPNVALGKNGGSLVSTGSNESRAWGALGNCTCGGQAFGLVREVILFTTALSPTERQAVEREQGAFYTVTVA